MNFLGFFNNLLPKWVTNNRGAIGFDGTDDKAEKTSSIVTSFPITHYVRGKFNVVGDFGLFAYNNLSSDRNYIYLGSEGAGSTFRYLVRDSSGTQAIADGGTADTNLHHFVTVSASSNDHRLYVDGVLVGTSTTNVSFPTGMNRTFLGHWERSVSETFCNCDISEFAVWSSALSVDEIKQLNGSIKGTVLGIDRANLIAYSPLDDIPSGQSADGTVFRDASGNSNELTGDDGANNTGLTSLGETSMSYPSGVILPSDNILNELLNIDETILISDNFNLIPTFQKLDISETIKISESFQFIIPQPAPFATKIISINPLIFVTDDSPPKIVNVDITDPENPTHIAEILIGIDSAQDVALNSTNNFIYIAGTNGKVVKVEIADLSNQTIIDLSDTDDLLTIETNSNFGLTYAGTENDTGELYLIDERETFLIDSDFQLLSPQQFLFESDFNIVKTFKVDSDFQLLAQQTFSMNTDFKCLDKQEAEVFPPPPPDPSPPPAPSPITPIDTIEPTNLTDYQVFIDSVELEDTDLILNSISITHSESEQSRASFRLTRKHDQLDTTLQGNNVTITNQNNVEIRIKGITEFNGQISELNSQYNNNIEFVQVSALADEKINQFNNITMSLPSLNSRLSLYDILVQNPRIFNPVAEEDSAENPKKFRGVRINLGTKVTQSLIKLRVSDSSGRIALEIQEGTFNPVQNHTYFWGTVTAENFGSVALGETLAQSFFYIGTSLAPVTEDLWNLTSASHHRQRIFENLIFKLGDGTLAVSDLNNIVSNPLDVHLQLQNKGFIIGGSGIITSKFKRSVDSSELALTGINSNEQTEVYEEIERQLGFTVGEAPFQDISARNGVLITKPRLVDEPDRLSSIKDAGFNFVDYNKRVAELEFEKLKNINGNILPDTSCTFNLTVDAYLYYDISLLTKINVDNTTQANIYNNINGFPVSVKSITINSANRQVLIEANNLKSNKELEELNGQFPSETDDEFNEKDRRTLIALKSDMRTGLGVQ